MVLQKFWGHVLLVSLAMIALNRNPQRDQAWMEFGA